MENKTLLDNPFYALARDIMPFTCEKYGYERVVTVLELCCLAGLPPEPASLVVDKIFPLTEEEAKKEDEMIIANVQAYALFGGSPYDK
ncbi:MAG: hypothetical protein ACKOXV_06755 [Bacteroidota bacterium]|jgi:hypothetical protein